MSLDIETLQVLLALVAAMCGGTFLTLWWRERREPAMLLGATGFLLFAAGLVALMAAPRVPLPGAVYVPHLVIVAGFAAWWAAARLWQGRRVIAWPIVAPHLLWLAVVLTPGVLAATAERAVLTLAMLAAYTFAIAWEFRSAADRRRHRTGRLLAFVCLGQASVYAVLAVVGAWAVSEGAAPGERWLVLVFLLPLATVVLCAFIVLTLHRDGREARLKELAATDVLTGALNRRGFMEQATRAMARAARQGSDVGLLTFDLDRFKAINDRYGHAAGDRVLRLFASIASANLREGDLLGRLGGEEFAALLLGADLAAARSCAERVRSGFAAASCAHGGASVTASVGLAMVESGSDIDSLLRQADEALYSAKRNGRDQVHQKLALAG